MHEHRDRRVGFFLGAAAACFLLIPVADPELRWVASGTGAVYVLLAIASFLDSRSRHRAK
jgi:hypothetical protein